MRFRVGGPRVSGYKRPRTSAVSPVVIDHTLDYGAKYLTTGKTYGAVIPNGSGWTSCAVNSGASSANATSHLSVNTTTGAISTTSTGRDNGMPNNPYTLNITFTNASGSTTANVTVRFSGTDGNGRDLATTWSVKDQTELLAVLQSASLTYGDTVSLRTGSYNPTQADSRVYRSATTAGTWNAYGTTNNAWMDDNWIVVRPHYGASPVINYISLYSNGGTSSFRMRFKDLTFTDNKANVSWDGLLQCRTQNTSWIQDLWIDSCTFNGNGWERSGIHLNAGGRNNAVNGGRLRVTECRFQDCENNVFVYCGPDFYAVGNENIAGGIPQAGDFFQLCPPCNGATVRWNKMLGYTENFTTMNILSIPALNPFKVEVSTSDAALVNDGWNFVIELPGSPVDGVFRATSDTVTVNAAAGTIEFSSVNGTGTGAYTGGGKIHAYLSHADFCQIRNDLASPGDFDDMNISENIIALVPTSNPYTQGVAGILGAATGSLYYNRFRARGNLFISKQVNMMSLGQCNDADIAWNTIIDYPDYTDQISPELVPKITANTGTGNVIKYNIYHSMDSAGATLTGNELLQRGNTAAYANAFTNPVGLMANSINAPVDYGLKVGGTWSANPVLPGATAYVDYANRTTSYPS